MTQLRWTALEFEGRGAFVFNPRANTTHLLSRELIDSASFPMLFGLERRRFQPALEDPATAIAITGAFEKEPDGAQFDPAAVEGVLPALYMAFHHTRAIVPLRTALAIARFVHKPRSALSVEHIGRVVGAVERKLGFADCYPRALLSAHLSAGSGLPCKVVIGILAPTSKLHAWCAVDGVIPYEPAYRHWWYSPLVVADVG